MEKLAIVVPCYNEEEVFKDSAEQLYDAIVAAGGSLAITDNSSPEEIQQTLQMSKKLFKRSLGVLMSHNRVIVDTNSIKIAK